MRQGRGTEYWSDELKLYSRGCKRFNCDWVAGLRHGMGSEYDRQGRLIYKGNFVENFRQGFGLRFNPKTTDLMCNGFWYKGLLENVELTADQKHKNYHTEKWQNEVHAGAFKAGLLMQGFGISYDLDGIKRYEGEWTGGLPHGKGIQYDDGGNRLFEGKWRKG
jgi:antitoxin component YwqK of YwqJK toxin-antitoxin module